MSQKTSEFNSWEYVTLPLGRDLAHWGLVNCFSFVFPGDISLHRS